MGEFFSANVADKSGLPVLQLTGELTVDGEPILKQAFQSLLELPADRTIFDFTGVKYINSAGISALLNLISSSRSRARPIIFCGLTRHLRKVIEIVGMHEYVTIYDNLEDALVR